MFPIGSDGLREDDFVLVPGHEKPRLRLFQYISLLDDSRSQPCVSPRRLFENANMASPSILNLLRSPAVEEPLKRLFDQIESSPLSQEERVFCRILIKKYLAFPGYKRYQSFVKAMWMIGDGPNINLNNIKDLLLRLETPINELKEICQQLHKNNKGVVHLFSIKACEKFQSLSASLQKERKKLLTILNPEESEKKAYRRLISDNQKVKALILNELSKLLKNKHLMPADTREFVDKLIDLYVYSSSDVEFKKKLSDLIQHQMIRMELLEKLLPLLEEHMPKIQSLARCHQRFRKGYLEALTQAEEMHQKLREVTLEETIPYVNHEKCLITVPYSRFRAALNLFNRDFRWLNELSTSPEEDVYGRHILAVLLCGIKGALSTEELSGDPCCFVVEELTRLKHPFFKIPIHLPNGSSFIEKRVDREPESSDLSQEERWKTGFIEKAKSFVQDCILRTSVVTVGDDQFVSGYFREEDLENPLFVECIARNYLQYLKLNPKKLIGVFNSPLFKFAKKCFGENFLEALLTQHIELTKDPLLHPIHAQVILKILNCVKNENPYFQMAVALKVLETIILVNQSLPGDTCRDIAHYLNSDFANDAFMATNAAGCSFTFYPLQCDAFSCQGPIALKLIGDNTNFFGRLDLFHAHVRYVCQIPSMEGLDHAEGTRNPVISLSDLTFSPNITVVALDHLVSKIDSDRVEGLTFAHSLGVILVRFQGLDEEFAIYNSEEKENNSIMFLKNKILVLFDIDNQLKKIFLTEAIRAEVKIDLIAARDSAIINLKTLLAKLGFYNSEGQSQELLKFKEFALQQFPELKKR